MWVDDGAYVYSWVVIQLFFSIVFGDCMEFRARTARRVWDWAAIVSALRMPRPTRRAKFCPQRRKQLHRDAVGIRVMLPSGESTSNSPSTTSTVAYVVAQRGRGRTIVPQILSCRKIYSVSEFFSEMQNLLLKFDVLMDIE